MDFHNKVFEDAAGIARGAIVGGRDTLRGVIIILGGIFEKRRVRGRCGVWVGLDLPHHRGLNVDRGGWCVEELPASPSTGLDEVVPAEPDAGQRLPWWVSEHP